MTPPVWGTFSVRDHVHPEAFLREVLLFDRLVVPYPDPSFPDERARWYRPNPEDETENWQPDRLDELLAVLGTADAYGMAGADGHHGARCVQPVVWNPNTWQEMKTRLGAAGMLDADPFLSTARGVIFGPDVPAVVDAVAPGRSEADWRAEAGTLTRNPPSDVSTHDAIMQLARPLLLPPRGHDELETLRRAVDLAREPGYVSLRHAYYDWFREFTTRIRPDNPLAPGISLDPASLWLAAEELRALWTKEQATVTKLDKRRFWDRTEVGCVSLGTAGTVAMACLAALPLAGAGVGLLGFAGWGVGRWNRERPARTLSGASMFVAADRRLGWLSN